MKRVHEPGEKFTGIRPFPHCKLSLAGICRLLKHLVWTDVSLERLWAPDFANQKAKSSHYRISHSTHAKRTQLWFLSQVSQQKECSYGWDVCKGLEDDVGVVVAHNIVESNESWHRGVRTRQHYLNCNSSFTDDHHIEWEISNQLEQIKFTNQFE